MYRILFMNPAECKDLPDEQTTYGESPFTHDGSFDSCMRFIILVSIHSPLRYFVVSEEEYQSYWKAVVS